MYREAEQTQVAESAEADASEGSKESNDDQSSEVDSRAQYDSDFRDEVPSNVGVFVLPTPQTLNSIDFGDLSNFENLINEDKVEMIKRRYPFC